MKKLLFPLLSLIVAALQAEASEDACTFDFFEVSSQKVERRHLQRSENLLDETSVWDFDVPRVWNAARQVDEILTNSAARAQIRVGKEKDVLALEIPAEVVPAMGGAAKAEMLHAYVSKTLTLATTNGGPYCLAFSYQGEHLHGSVEWGAYVYAYDVAADGSQNLIQRARIPDSWKDSATWNKRLFSFDVPPGAKSVRLMFRFSGVGHLRFKNVRLASLPPPVETEEVSLRVRAVGELDDRFCIESGDVGSVAIGMKCTKGRKLPPYRTKYEFVVPRGFAYVGVNVSETGHEPVVTAEADGTTRVLATMPGDFQTRDNQYPDRWDLAVLIRAVDAPGTTGPLSVRVLRDGREVGRLDKLSLVAVPRQTVPAPRRFLPGAFFSGSQYAYRTPGATEAFADFLRGKGVRWLVPEQRDVIRDPHQVAVWRSRGIRCITPQCMESLSNGYLIGLDGNRPQEDRFVAGKGVSPNFWQGYGICPAAVYEERPYFVTNTWPRLAGKANGVDGMWCNWEPQVFQGCHCPVCRGRMKDWCARTGDSEEHFLSQEHAKMVKVLARRFAEGFGTGEVGFMPAVGYLEVGTYAREHDHPARNRPFEYAESVKWLPVWGPYRGWSQGADGEDITESGPYNGKRGISLAYFLWVKDIRAEMDRRHGAKCPKLMAQPTGCNWTIQPEWLEISMDAAFFNRFEADIPWMYPYGADARHWQAYGRSVARSARYEDAVYDGKRADDETQLAPLPGFERASVYPDRDRLPKVRDVPFLQQVTYDYKGTRYVACFNFDDQSHAEFVLRTRGLVGDRQVVNEDGVALAGGKVLSGAELSDRGVVCSVGASRCRVFEIRPASTGLKQ